MGRAACLTLLIIHLPAFADDPNTWKKVAEGQIGPRSSAPLVYLPAQKAFTLLGGYISHEPKGPFPFDLLAFDSASASWKNWFTEGTADRGKDVGPVRDPGFKSPCFELIDKDGAPRLSPRQARSYNQYAYAPWDGCVYALVCGHSLRFDPRKRTWTDLAPTTPPGDDLSGPGLLTFAGALWSNHNYKTYAYDPLSRRMILVGGLTHFYDLARHRWIGDEWFPTAPFAGSKYVTLICPTPHGVYVWARMAAFSSEVGLFRLDGNKAWSRVKTTGAPLPRPVVDAGSTIVYDTRRDRFLLTTVEGLKPGEPPGQLWSVDRKTGECSVLDPKGRERLITPRFAREAVHVASQDVFLFGVLIGGDLQVPFCLPESNTWHLASIPGADVMNSHRKQPGGSVDLGLLYDAKRDLVYAVLCHLRPGALRVLRVDASKRKR